jgi:tyrosyl-DNA phosphodiesterase-1
MIIAIMHDEAQVGGKGKGKKADYDSDYDSDTDTDTDVDDDDVVEIKDEKVGWAYIGSHNFTPSAWGNLSGSSFNPVLNVRVFYDSCELSG